MAKKEQKTKKEKAKKPQKKEKAAKKSKSKKTKKSDFIADDGLVIIDEKIEEDKEAELEARKAYLEEARSQEVDD
ncbi:hypothetical protein C4565_07245 [Candidatus Parcubacteria bacterium]|nr:MAG: hypothetical protein C4565_07245 [Candidatus Parcubacteria bacterium]